MNDSGGSAGPARGSLKATLDHVIVLHDEIDLPFGEVRVKLGGGVAGHNGLRSISAHVGNDYRRVRIGVGHPGVKELVHPHVLSDFAKSEKPWVEALCDIIADNAELLAKGQDSSFQNKVHLAMQAKGFVETKQRDEPDED
jgi:PTH1 family peptidyl-tRNA hydrolase